MALDHLKAIDKDLAERVSVVKDLDLRLVLIDASKKVDKFYHLQGLEEHSTEPCFYRFSCWGDTGSRGEPLKSSKQVSGPLSEEQMRREVEEIFETKTGCKLLDLKARDRAAVGKYWLQHRPVADEKTSFMWEYYVDDGVDGKRKGWHPYKEEASEEVEKLYLKHVANDKESRTAAGTISSGCFTYKVDFKKMTQQNTKTGKVRTIQRSAKVSKSKPKAKRSKVATTSTRKHGGTVKTSASKTTVKKTVLKETAKRKDPKPEVATAKAKATKDPKGTKKTSPIASGKHAKSKVWSGKSLKTSSGLKKGDLKKNMDGKLVSKRKSEAGRNAFARVACWIAACKQARAELGITGFVAVKKGTPLYEKAKELYPTAKPHVLKVLKPQE